MRKQINRTDTTSVAKIELADASIAKGIISIDLHQENSLLDQAVFECFDELLLSGTKTYSRTELLNAVNSIGADIEINISDGLFTLEVSSTSKTWNQACKLVTSILTESTFTATELKRTKILAINALHDQKEDSSAQALLALKSNLYPETDRKASATEEQLENQIHKITNTDVVAVYKRLKSRPIVASVSGDPSACRTFSKLVTDIAPTKVSSTITTEENNKKTDRLLLTNIPSRQNIDLSIGCRIPLKPGDPDYAAFAFGLAVLAKWGGFAGRLMSIVREKEGLTYSIYGRTQGFTASENGYLRILTFFNPSQITQGLTSTFREISKIHKTGITDTESASFKTIIETQTVLQNDSFVTRLRILHEFNKLGFDFEQIDKFNSDLLEVTKKDVNAAIKKYLDPKVLTISAAGPTKLIEKELEALSKKI